LIEKPRRLADRADDGRGNEQEGQEMNQLITEQELGTISERDTKIRLFPRLNVRVVQGVKRSDSLDSRRETIRCSATKSK
jgi:hypothetical protein